MCREAILVWVDIVVMNFNTINLLGIVYSRHISIVRRIDNTLEIYRESCSHQTHRQVLLLLNPTVLDYWSIFHADTTCMYLPMHVLVSSK